MNVFHYAFPITLKDDFLWKITFSCCLRKKKPIVFMKQSIVLPLAHLNKVIMNSYAWLQLFLFFQNPLWIKNAFTMPLNKIIKRCTLCFPWNSKLFMNDNHIDGFWVDEYLWMYLWNVRKVCSSHKREYFYKIRLLSNHLTNLKMNLLKYFIVGYCWMKKR